MNETNGEISEIDAVRLAQQECQRLGIVWREPYSVKRGWRRWQIRTPSNIRGGNTTIFISRENGDTKVRHYIR
jgi:hypothetical protein